MSRFVTAGGADAPAASDAAKEDAWAKAQAQLEALRNKPKTQDGKQEGGKSLYEVLQENKAEKERAHEESMKLKNQFRALDDDELDFLDSVDETQRQKEAAKRKETAEELESFRKQQAQAEKNSLSTATTESTEGAGSVSQTTWQTKKRRRKDGDSSAPKIRKTTTGDSDGISNAAGSSTSLAEAKQDESVNVVEGTPSTNSAPKANPVATSTGLGLGAYEDSDSE